MSQDIAKCPWGAEDGVKSTPIENQCSALHYYRRLGEAVENVDQDTCDRFPTNFSFIETKWHLAHRATHSNGIVNGCSGLK